jgi:hypothetical protein
MKTTKQILIDAAELIDEKGKAVSAYYDFKKNCYCAAGAIAAASGFDAQTCKVFWWRLEPSLSALQGLANHIQPDREASTDNPTDVIFPWNDDPANSAPDIADAMRKAAEAL